MREVETLLKEVQALAQSRGHQLGLFSHVDRRTYIAECQRCFGTVIVTPEPGPEEEKVVGPPVTTDCPSASG
ncbi:MAG: hypothetical protein JO235_02035 [Chroococcidiopsidaceae cyanobacterium CP_BM_RX_35]|nr:hypothetical protein [Chroococcidiopsidaceae cyanobacterium CP_BM_RX_35]